jgi:hypothetical protein
VARSPRIFNPIKLTGQASRALFIIVKQALFDAGGSPERNFDLTLNVLPGHICCLKVY